VAASRIVTPITPVKPSRMVRKAEASEFDRKRASVRDAVVDVGTGQTILKLRQKAIPKLIDQGKLGHGRDAGGGGNPHRIYRNCLPADVPGDQL
jgi:hypothetical protein